ncbi:carbohydrate kinase [Secundilactobacillus oryzae JCM 18671]|uniref:ADP-dependent (S)-NAD(P)H-hydrate dehydratase n=1 Tax=Secundilactobacillus oryzae JCM 18671 TaxID=1291743 RepID=A0A081BG80_9LACO|nr:NAD(P)H-hydrate dehydratase [Secundilactobacillus oryzae]GAK47048.1 carbohydrate kinase [Secundilactobacillus oryzae JCM 18671]
MKRLDQSILTNTIRIRPDDSYKGTYGRVTLVGGNQNFGGAIIMASEATVYSGAGLVTTLTHPDNSAALHARLPEAMFADVFMESTPFDSLIQSADVVVIGPGLGEGPESVNLLRNVFHLITPDQTVVIDGSAITILATHSVALPDARLIFTPHQMEWQRLSGIKITDQTEAANQAVRDQLNATVVLKSHRTEIYTANGIYQNPLGTPAQATGGMGDTLAGMIGGFTAQFANTDNAVMAAVYAHSAIAELLAQNQYVVLPTQIIRQLPQFMHQHQAN